MSVIIAEKPQGLDGARTRKRKRALFDTMLGRAFLQAMAVAILLVLWQVGVRLGVISDFLFGAPSGIYATFLRMAGSGELVADTGYTLFEAILGFVIGTIFGSVAGLALWYSIFVARLVEPFIVAINSVPKIALAPIIILWFGTGLVSKVALAVSLTAIVALIHLLAARPRPSDLHRFELLRPQHRLGRPVRADAGRLCPLLRHRPDRTAPDPVEGRDRHASGSSLIFASKRRV
jgi:hypothetical protein